MHALSVVCPTCAAAKSSPCFHPLTQKPLRPHKDRVEVARRVGAGRLRPPGDAPAGPAARREG